MRGTRVGVYPSATAAKMETAWHRTRATVTRVTGGRTRPAHRCAREDVTMQPAVRPMNAPASRDSSIPPRTRACPNVHPRAKMLSACHPTPASATPGS